jgi:hypothetical protein
MWLTGYLLGEEELPKGRLDDDKENNDDEAEEHYENPFNPFVHIHTNFVT